MKQVLSVRMEGLNFRIPETPMPGSHVLNVKLSHWEGKRLDMALEVSYDGGATWHAGGGCSGAASSNEGIEFHIRYGKPPTHLRGSFSSEHVVNSNIDFTAEE